MPCYALDDLVPVVDPTAYVHPSAVLIGAVIVGPGCYIGPCASLRGDFGRIVIGAGANIQDGCVLHSFPDAELRVGENGHIGHGAVLHGCTIHADALVGMNAVVMDGAEVGAQAMVAACAFVPAGSRLPPRTLCVGVPARALRELSGEEMARKLDGTRAYQHLALRSAASLREVSPLAAPPRTGDH
ncbi:MAG: transferase hexapeptide repeat family protein [Burkholderiales bacterium]|jgi:phenylacetic acid degradation protein|nr:transferase hexapeptide repeat family protein [Burkholderiales bacterium]MBP7521154.1 transferase hexapeptide repeat family protein [Leptothrix sp. (in: b-proteobacteria)]